MIRDLIPVTSCGFCRRTCFFWFRALKILDSLRTESDTLHWDGGRLYLTHEPDRVSLILEKGGILNSDTSPRVYISPWETEWGLRRHPGRWQRRGPPTPSAWPPNRKVPTLTTAVGVTVTLEVKHTLPDPRRGIGNTSRHHEDSVSHLLGLSTHRPWDRPLARDIGHSCSHTLWTRGLLVGWWW